MSVLVLAPMLRPLRAFALAAALSLATIATAAGTPARAVARAPGRCALHDHERVLQRTSAAVVLRDGRRRIVACVVRTGHRRVLWRPDPLHPQSGYRIIAMSGTRVLALDLWREPGDFSETLVLEDPARLRDRVVVASPDAGVRLREPRLARDGAVTWIQHAGVELSLFLRTATGGVRTIDRGLAVEHPRFDGALLRWRHGGDERVAPVTPPDACPRRFSDGSLELGIYASELCLRATGSSMSFSAFSSTIVTAGSWAVGTISGNALLLADASRGSIERIDATGPSSVVAFTTDAHGSTAWLTRDTYAGPWFQTPDQLWVRDGRGTRRVAIDEAVRDLVLDGSTLHWRQTGLPGPQQLQLIPRTATGAAARRATAVAARTRPRSMCAPRRGQQVVARSDEAALLVGPSWRLIGCSRRNGHRRIVYEAEHDFTSWGWFDVRELRGTHVLFEASSADQYGDHGKSLLVDDAVHPHRRGGIDDGDAVQAASIGLDGSVAWIAEHGPTLTLRIRTPTGAHRLVDEGLDLGGLGIDGDVARWSHGIETRSTRLQPHDACPRLFRDGGQEVGIAWVANRLTACERATGRTVAATEATPWVPWAIAGSVVAVATDGGGIAILDPRAGAETVAVSSGADTPELVVDEAGSLAWLASAGADAPTTIVVHDASGTRTAGSIPAKTPYSAARLGHDGNTVVWADANDRLGSATMAP